LPENLARGNRIDAMKWLVQFFTWWNEQTLNTRFHTWRNGERVGEDQFGNIYYRWRGGKIDPALGFERRWVIYNGESDGSRTPPGWYGWLHHMTDTPPTEEEYKPRAWELPYAPNATGTPAAWRPQGSTLATAARPKATGDYQAWSPEG
jgi:NADH:ubiquinone oxidoreductase subunit